MIALCLFIWWLVGVAGFVYWWVHEHDLKLNDLIFGCILAGWLGPIAWVSGRFIHGKPLFNYKAVIIKKR